MNVTTLRRLLVVSLLLGSTALAQSKATWPTKSSLQEFPTAVGLSYETGATTNCAVVLTGTTFFHQSATTVAGSTNIVDTEIVAMDLSGALPDGSPLRLRAGSELIGQASAGQIISTNSLFPAEATLDVIAELALPGGTNALTVVPVPLATRVRALPPINETYTNLTSVALVDAGDTNTVLGTLNSLWFQPAQRGKSTVLGVSIDVAATNTITALKMEVCEESAEAAAVARIKRCDLSGPVSPNFVCDEILGTNLLFAAKLDKTLRAPDWRGAHGGNWILYTLGSSGKTNLVAYGRMEGTEGVGTHRLGAIGKDHEGCADCAHFEGRLNGKIIDKSVIKGGRLEAAYAGWYLAQSGDPVTCCPPPSAPPRGAVALAIDGVIITKCLPAAPQ